MAKQPPKDSAGSSNKPGDASGASAPAGAGSAPASAGQSESKPADETQEAFPERPAPEKGAVPPADEVAKAKFEATQPEHVRDAEAAKRLREQIAKDAAAEEEIKRKSAESFMAWARDIIEGQSVTVNVYCGHGQPIAVKTNGNGGVTKVPVKVEVHKPEPPFNPAPAAKEPDGPAEAKGKFLAAQAERIAAENAVAKPNGNGGATKPEPKPEPTEPKPDSGKDKPMGDDDSGGNEPPEDAEVTRTPAGCVHWVAVLPDGTEKVFSNCRCGRCKPVQQQLVPTRNTPARAETPEITTRPQRTDTGRPPWWFWLLALPLMLALAGLGLWGLKKFFSHGHETAAATISPPTLVDTAARDSVRAVDSRVGSVESLAKSASDKADNAGRAIDALGQRVVAAEQKNAEQDAQISGLHGTVANLAGDVNRHDEELARLKKAKEEPSHKDGPPEPLKQPAPPTKPKADLTVFLSDVESSWQAWKHHLAIPEHDASTVITLNARHVRGLKNFPEIAALGRKALHDEILAGRSSEFASDFLDKIGVK